MKKSMVSIGICLLLILIVVSHSLNAQNLSIKIPTEKEYRRSFPEICKEIVWDNGMHEEGAMPSQYDEEYPFDYFQADDFLFNESTSVESVYWHSAYWGGEPEPFDWCISFYLDDGSGQFPDGLPYSPSFKGPYCFTDEEIEKEENYPSHFYMKVDLPEIIIFEAGQKYWISIWGQGATFPQCGWSFHKDYILNPTVYGSDYFEVPYWTPGREFWTFDYDMAFQLLYVPNNPPDSPVIDGPSSGIPDTEYCFTFHSTDPDGDNIKYFIDWSDGINNETTYVPSCEPIEVCRTFSDKGFYFITAVAVDIWGAYGIAGCFEFEIPRTRATAYSLFFWFFERFPIMERLLNLLKQ